MGKLSTYNSCVSVDLLFLLSLSCLIPKVKTPLRSKTHGKVRFSQEIKDAEAESETLFSSEN